MLAFLASLRRNRRLVSDLVRRDLRGRYIGSSMGFFWSVIFPIINLFVYMFVFRLILKTRWSDHQGTSEVALLMLAGIMVWQAFSESTFRMTSALVDNSNLIQKVVFPSEVLPVYLTISSLVNMLIGLTVTIAGVAWFAYVKPQAGPAPPPARAVAFGAHVPGSPSAAPALTTHCAFRCASLAARTRFTAMGVIDEAEPAWSQALPDGRPGGYASTGAGDTVYAATGEWARVKEKKGYLLKVDRWRDRAGHASAPPADGVQALVAGEPEKRMGLSLSIVVIPILMLSQGLFMLGLGCLLSTFNLLVRDTFHMIGVALTVWMFSTPIFYPERMVRDAGYGWLPDWNPMCWLITCYRQVLVYGDWPDLGLLLRFWIAGGLMLLLGAAFFMSQKPRFPDLL